MFHYGTPFGSGRFVWSGKKCSTWVYRILGTSWQVFQKEASFLTRRMRVVWKCLHFFSPFSVDLRCAREYEWAASTKWSYCFIISDSSHESTLPPFTVNRFFQKKTLNPDFLSTAKIKSQFFWPSPNILDSFLIELFKHYLPLVQHQPWSWE